MVSRCIASWAEVELAHQRLAELVEHEIDAVARAEVSAIAQECGDIVQRLEVGKDALAQAGTLHLEHDLAPVLEAGAVHLRHRGGGERLTVHAQRARGDQAELLGEHGFDLAERQRLAAVLQPGERLGVGRRHDVRARGEQLAQLDERRAEALDVRGEAVSRGLGLRVALRLLRQQLHQSGPRDQVAAAVLEQQQRQFLVMPQMLRFQRKRHARKRIAISVPRNESCWCRDFPTGGPMAGKSVKNKRKYSALKRKGISKTRAARISTAGKSASRKGGKKK
jgi:hypothetical protein